MFIFFTKKILALSFATILFCGIFFSSPAFAGLRDQVNKQMRAVPGVTEEYKPRDPREVAAGVVQSFMLFLGSIFLILVLISGFWLLTARGEAAKVQKAKDTMRRAIIGLFLCLSAYSISSFVLTRLRKEILQTPTDNPANDCYDWFGCDDNT